ncbi:hypothetical protein N7519_000069 [Penicillium mononematosum]|uniref:uncharacterized protein n=1 Tax=Penicillium mononematosum TaxID=268346 RepID=UPI002547A27D|nr:uncharacterized protein N7519_000069 [Penicillium mononematosum]KAJ6190048.1 hypothetical protein N7519_000069 [Penicillium mononematosum]
MKRDRKAFNKERKSFQKERKASQKKDCTIYGIASNESDFVFLKIENNSKGSEHKTTTRDGNYDGVLRVLVHMFTKGRSDIFYSLQVAIPTVRPSFLYRTSVKEPDFSLMIRGGLLPTVAVESGWSKPMTKLLNDLNALLVGGDGSIKVVIIIKWSRLTGNRVSGVA